MGKFLPAKDNSVLCTLCVVLTKCRPFQTDKEIKLDTKKFDTTSAWEEALISILHIPHDIDVDTPALNFV